MGIHVIKEKLKTLADKQTAEISKRFFKTGPGEYGEGDIFHGIRVPLLRKLAKDYQNIPIDEATVLLTSPIHEERLLALFILMHIFQKGEESVRKRIYILYLRNTRHINNWDLVDASAEHIAGAFLLDKSKTPLYRLAKSNNLWERRIAIMSTFNFIKHERYAETLRISRLLLGDQEDLIHKAVGWMLREVGKRDLSIEEGFLQDHYKKMPRTMLRYAIEKFPESKRQNYLKGKL